MNNTLQRNNYSPDSITTPDDHTIEFPESKTYTIPIVIQEKQQSASKYFIEVDEYRCCDSHQFVVYECVGIIVVEKYGFDTMKEAVMFIQEKGGM